MKASLASAAIKLARRVTLTCKKCGKEWSAIPSRASRSFCSDKCAGNVKNAYPKRKTCVCCGEEFLIKSKNSRRVTTCSASCKNKVHSKWMSEHGHTPLKFRDESKWLDSLHSDEYRAKLSRINMGKVFETPKTKRFSLNHTRAVECFLRDTRNVIHYVRNITRFVHLNPALFHEDDVRWKKVGKTGKSWVCKATHGLQMVARGDVGTWKGWMLVSGREGRERFDLIGRNWHEGQ